METALIDTKALVFGTDAPGGILSRAQEVSTKLAPIVERCKLYNVIKGRKHVRAEGWTSMIAMLGIFPVTEYAKRIEREGEIVYEAKVRLQHISGAVIGAGEAICSSKERNWEDRDEYAIKSMAQTRAVGKACRLSFSWIMALAGFDPLPAEEMPIDTIAMPQEAVNAETGEFPPAAFEGKGISKKQQGFLFYRTKEKGIIEEALKAKMILDFNKSKTSDLTSQELDKLLKWLEKMPDVTAQ